MISKLLSTPGSRRSLDDALAAAKAFETHEAVASIMAVVDPASLRMEHRVAVTFG